MEPAVSFDVQASVRFFTFCLVDLRERAVALAGVVAVVGRPRVGERLQQFRRIEAAPLRDRRTGGSRERGTASEQFFAKSFQCRQVSGHVVHVFVGQGREHRLVRLQRILDLDFRARRRRGESSADGRRPAGCVIRKLSMRNDRALNLFADGSVTVAVDACGSIVAWRAPSPAAAAASAADP